ncbi:recombinase family protein [Patescibacteria group bacterium]|nr:recombinase family protein [Patescibacteria group bacterium]
MKSVLFCRVSSKEQEDEGYSLPAQEKLLLAYAMQKGIERGRTFSISESASGKMQRDTFNEMLQYLKDSHIKVIICEKVDRLTRNLKDAVAINDWINQDPERQVHFVKENVTLNRDSRSNEKFIWNIKVSVAQYYIDNLSEEVKKGQKEKLAQGWLPTKPPLGYKIVGEKGRKIHVPDEEKKHFALRMFSLYASGNWSTKRIAEQLFEEGLRTDNGRMVPKSRIHEYLSDPFYIGLNRWNGECYPGKQERLITQEIFDKVQQLLKGKNSPKYKKHIFVFRGHLRCAECGGLITWESQKGTNYGHCNHYRDCKQSTWSKEYEIEDQLMGGFKALELKNTRLIGWISKALKESHREELAYYQGSLDELKERHDTLQRRIERIYEDKLDGIIDRDTYQRKFQEYTAERQRVLEKIEQHGTANTKYYELGSHIFDLSQQAQRVYRTAKSPEDKGRLIRLVFTNLRVDNGKLSYEYSKAFQLLHQAVSLTNGSDCSKETIFEQTVKNIFEPTQKRVAQSVKQSKTPSLSTERPAWLPRLDSNQQPPR